MRNLLLCGVFAVVAAAPAFADDPPPAWTLTGNVDLATDYAFRGVSQTDENPAIQGGLDFSAGAFYLGTWGSSIDFGTGGANMEWDVYGGYKVPLGAATLDLGVIGYLYPGAKDTGAELDYWEFYAKPSIPIGDKFTLGGQIAYSPEFTGKSGDGWYEEINGTLALDPKFSLSGAVGHQSVDLAGFFAGEDSYTTWNFGGTYSDFGLSFDLRYIGTDVDNVSIYDDRVIFTIKKSM